MERVEVLVEGDWKLATKSIYWALTGALYIFLPPCPSSRHALRTRRIYVHLRTTDSLRLPCLLTHLPWSVHSVSLQREKETQIEKKAGDGKAKRGVSSPEGIHRVIRGANGCIPSNCHRPAIRQTGRIKSNLPRGVLRLVRWSKSSLRCSSHALGTSLSARAIFGSVFWRFRWHGPPCETPWCHSPNKGPAELPFAVKWTVGVVVLSVAQYKCLCMQFLKLKTIRTQLTRWIDEICSSAMICWPCWLACYYPFSSLNDSRNYRRRSACIMDRAPRRLFGCDLGRSQIHTARHSQSHAMQSDDFLSRTAPELGKLCPFSEWHHRFLGKKAVISRTMLFSRQLGDCNLFIRLFRKLTSVHGR